MMIKSYVYKYCVFKNNLRDGVQFVAAFDSLAMALNCKEHLQRARGGCCDVVKKRFLLKYNRPVNNYIYNNYKYN